MGAAGRLEGLAMGWVEGNAFAAGPLREGGTPPPGSPPAVGGEGVMPGWPPIFWRRDFRSIFGFLSSAIVAGETLRVPMLLCQRSGTYALSGKGVTRAGE
jgi:hypothetical protein